MKKSIVLLIVCLLALALCACSAPAEEAAEEAAEETAGLANPVTEYGSLSEINEIAQGKLARPATMGVTDESYKIIDAGDYQIAEYDFSVNGTPYTYRFANGITEDISGIYAEGGALFADEASDSDQIKEFEGGKAVRHFTLDGQYVLTVMDDGALSADDFQAIADELFAGAKAENG